MRTEDQVRQEAQIILGLDDNEKNVIQGTGQITSFKALGFKQGTMDRPDGWYLPKDIGRVAIVLETKPEPTDLYKEQWANELLKNVRIVQSKYNDVIGILYDGKDIRVYKGEDEITASVSPTLQHKSYYIDLYTDVKIDKQKIYRLTKKINDCLHTQFGIKNLYHRMIFTACALVAKRYGAGIIPGMDFATMKQAILSKLGEQLLNDKKENPKIELLTEVYQEIKMNNSTNQDAIDDFIKNVTEISACVNSNNWNGEDVMGIFFNEFNRYKKKSESGQIFTPDHITSLMYRILDVNLKDRVLDAACGSGAFLVKAMCNMIKEAGGVRTKEAARIKREQLYGIEFDREIFALACANMLIHKDGKTNLEQMDSTTPQAKEWIEKKGITKVLMNPPFERKYGCLKIVKNVLDSVPNGTKCAFILPDKKLEKDMTDKRLGNKLLKYHRLSLIVKLPENLFSAGVTTSIFVFDAHVPQNGNSILGYYIADDGLETVKNQGRQDIRDRWPSIEDYWVKAIKTGEDSMFNTKQVINPSEHLSYQKPEVPFSISEEDFMQTVLNYEIFTSGIDTKLLESKLLKEVLYSSTVKKENGKTTISIEINGN